VLLQVKSFMGVRDCHWTGTAATCYLDAAQPRPCSGWEEQKKQIRRAAEPVRNAVLVEDMRHSMLAFRREREGMSRDSSPCPLGPTSDISGLI
jgi:hypothetical protein